MPKFEVNLKEVHDSFVTLDADDVEDARRRMKQMVATHDFSAVEKYEVGFLDYVLGDVEWAIEKVAD